MAQRKDSSYLIVGAGVFGVSTAYHLIKKHPGASVTLVDKDAFDADERVAASWDWNKVVRADYDDFMYCQLALEAQDLFTTDPLWKPFFHQTGVYWICRSDYAQNVIDHHKRLGRKDDIVALPVSEARKLYGGLFEDADYSGAKEVLVNRASGWAAAGDCLRAVTRETVRLGVRYVTAETAFLTFDERGRCTGVKTTAGDTLAADHTILSTGAYTPKLLELSAAKSGLANLRAGNRIVAAGITTGMAKLDEEDYRKYANMPVGFQGYTGHGELPSGFMPAVLLFPPMATNSRTRQTLYRQSPTDKGRRAQVVGSQDLRQHQRNPAWPARLCAAAGEGLQPVESLAAAEARHC